MRETSAENKKTKPSEAEESDLQQRPIHDNKVADNIYCKRVVELPVVTDLRDRFNLWNSGAHINGLR